MHCPMTTRCDTCSRSQWQCGNTHVCPFFGAVASDYSCERWKPLVFGPNAVFGAMVEESDYVAVDVPALDWVN